MSLNGPHFHMTDTNTHPNIPLASIVDNRPTADREAGTDLNYTNFKESIRTIGVIQPIVLNRVQNLTELTYTYELCAGGRRRKALMELGFTELIWAKSCDPTTPGYVFVDELSEHQKLEIELDENIQRRNITWQQECLSILRVHEARERASMLARIEDSSLPKWGMRQTGALMNVSLGDLSNMKSVVTALRADDKQVCDASNFRDALGVLIQRNVDIANAKLLAQGLSSVNTKVPPNVTTTTDIDKAKKRPAGEVLVIFDDEEESTSRSPGEQNIKPAPGVEADANTITTIPLSTMLFHADSKFDLPKLFPDNFFDFGLADFPYGIDMDNLDLKKQDRIDKEHDVEANAELMPILLREYYRTLKDKSFLCFFYDLDYHERLRKWAEDIGFIVQRWPEHWCKTHPCRNQAPGYNFTKSVEHCYVMRKGNMTLNRPQTTNWKACDGAIERKMYDNAFAKPFDMWKVLIDACALPGMKVADFCCGEGSSLRAAIMCGLMPYGVEVSDLHYPALVENIKNAYKTLTHGKVEFQ